MSTAGANAQRGEVGLRLGEREIVLRPSFDAMVKIEGRLGEGLGATLGRIAARGLGARDCEAFLVEGGGLRREDARMLVEEYGLAACADAIVAFLVNALQGGMKAEAARAAIAEHDEKNRAAPGTVN